MNQLPWALANFDQNEIKEIKPGGTISIRRGVRLSLAPDGSEGLIEIDRQAYEGKVLLDQNEVHELSGWYPGQAIKLDDQCLQLLPPFGSCFHPDVTDSEKRTSRLKAAGFLNATPEAQVTSHPLTASTDIPLTTSTDVRKAKKPGMNRRLKIYGSLLAFFVLAFAGLSLLESKDGEAQKPRQEPSDSVSQKDAKPAPANLQQQPVNSRQDVAFESTGVGAQGPQATKKTSENGSVAASPLSALSKNTKNAENGNVSGHNDEGSIPHRGDVDPTPSENGTRTPKAKSSKDEATTSKSAGPERSAKIKDPQAPAAIKSPHAGPSPDQKIQQAQERAAIKSPHAGPSPVKQIQQAQPRSSEKLSLQPTLKKRRPEKGTESAKVKANPPSESEIAKYLALIESYELEGRFDPEGARRKLDKLSDEMPSARRLEQRVQEAKTNIGF